MLNERTNATKENIHIMATSLCDRNCKYCCNKQYDLNTIPYVTDEELREAKRIFITGGEPFAYSSPCDIAKYYKRKYPNIEQVIVYTNAWELRHYLDNGGTIHDIDGLSVSIKADGDIGAFNWLVNEPEIMALHSNRLYVFDHLYRGKVGNFEMFEREWQKDFTPADDSIFRRV